MKTLRFRSLRGKPRLDRGNVSLVLAGLALLIAATGMTPAEAARAVKRAINADKVDGLSASKTPRAGQLLALGKDGKFPPSVVPPGTPGPRGPRGAQGPAGAPGVPGPSSFNRTVFRAHVVADQSTKNEQFQVVLFGGEDFDPENVFDPATSRFTAPVAGYYRFEASVGTSYLDPNKGETPQRLLFGLGTSRAGMGVRGTDENSVGYQQADVSGLMKLERGDTVWVSIRTELAPPNPAGSPASPVGDPRKVMSQADSVFSGSLVGPA